MSAMVEIDASRFNALLDRIMNRADHLGPTIAMAAERCVSSISGIPVRTGRLAASPRVAEVTDRGALIVTDVEYAGYVFYGTEYMAARPPEVLYEASEFADDIARAIF